MNEVDARRLRFVTVIMVVGLVVSDGMALTPTGHTLSQQDVDRITGAIYSHMAYR
jgi:hypothetical protein